jgi:hypothetical protein
MNSTNHDFQIHLNFLLRFSDLVLLLLTFTRKNRIKIALSTAAILRPQAALTIWKALLLT